MEALVQDAVLAITAKDDSEAALRDAIRRGADVNGMVACKEGTTGAHGLCSLLFVATSMGLAGICEVLLAEGADADIPTTIDSSVPLHTSPSIPLLSKASLPACMFFCERVRM